MPAACWLISIGPNRTSADENSGGAALRFWSKRDHEQVLQEDAAQQRADEDGRGRTAHQGEISDEREREPDEEHDGGHHEQQ